MITVVTLVELSFFTNSNFMQSFSIAVILTEDSMINAHLTLVLKISDNLGV